MMCLGDKVVSNKQSQNIAALCKYLTFSWQGNEEAQLGGLCAYLAF